MTDSLDDDSFSPSVLDLARLEAIEEGGAGVEAESGNWSVFKYKDSYTLFLNKGKYAAHEFQMLEKLIEFLGDLDKKRKRY